MAGSQFRIFLLDGCGQSLLLCLFSLDLFRFLNPGVQPVALPGQKLFFFLSLFRSQAVCLDQLPHEDLCLFRRLPFLQDLLPPESLDLTVTGRIDIFYIRHALLTKMVIFLTGFSLRVLEALFQFLIVSRMKNLAEDVFSIFGLGKEELEKVSLGNHGDPGKLVLVDPQQIFDALCHLPLFGPHIVVRIDKLGPGGFFCQPALAPFGRAPVLGIAFYSIVFAIADKLEDDIGLGLRQGILRAQHGFFPVLTAGKAVQGKADGVKNRRFSRPGISGDQI